MTDYSQFLPTTPSGDTPANVTDYSQFTQPIVTTGTQGQPRILITPKGAPQGVGDQAVDFAKSFPGGAVSGLSGVLSATGQAAQAEMGQPIDVPAPQQIDAALQQNVTGTLPMPQGPAGQYGRTAGQFLASAPFSPPIPGVGPVATGVGAVGAGLISETAGRATAGTPLEGPARIVAPIVGGLFTRRPSPVTEEQALKAGLSNAEVPTTRQLLQTGGAQINAAEAAGTKAYSSGTMEQLVSNIEATLRAAKSRDYRAPHTWQAIQELKGESEAGGIQEVRSLLGDIGTEGGHESRAARIAQEEIDNFLKQNEAGVAAGLEEGRGNYAAGMHAKAADIREDVATLRQKRAGYGGDARFVQATRQILSPVVEKWLKGEKNGISEDEFNAMRDIVEGTTTSNTLRGFGMVSPEKGILSTAVFGELAEKLGVKIAGTIALGSWLSNKLNTELTVSQINRLNEMFRKRSPMYETAVKSAADRYTKTMNDFATSPTQQSFVKFLVASRNFSAGLRKDGIPLSSGDLLKAIEAPENNQGGTNQ